MPAGSEKIKYVFVSNFYNHHQAPFAKAMDEKTGHSFAFIETAPIDSERLNMGWGGDEKPSYVLQSYTDAAADKRCRKIIDGAEVVIWGSCPFDMIKPRIRQKKLTFCYSERIFKQGFSGLGYWGRLIKYRLKLGAYQNDRHFLLCSSAYAAGDYSRMGLFRGRAFRWGYFPALRSYEPEALWRRKQGNEKLKLLWVARLLVLKHPECAVSAAEKLRDAGYDFELNIIGSGELEESIRASIGEKQLEDRVHMLGSMPPDMVREHMEQADIFLFTSDHNEGWGAVVNEAMNSGCAVVVSDAVGSAPYLIEDGENGFIYRSGDEEQLCSLVLSLAEDAQLRKKMGENACISISENWNGETAAERLLAFTEENKVFDRGIFSRHET